MLAAFLYALGLIFALVLGSLMWVSDVPWYVIALVIAAYGAGWWAFVEDYAPSRRG